MGRVTPVKDAKDTGPVIAFVCPRCKTTNFKDGPCESCGSAKDWTPPPPPPTPSAQVEAEERERKRLEELRIAELDAEYRAKQKAAHEAELARLDKILVGENQRAMEEHSAMIDKYAAEIERLKIRVDKLEGK